MSSLFEQLWCDYTQLNPQAQKIHTLLSDRGDTIVNDHIALRTYQHPKVGIDILAKPFLALGYEDKADYHFTEKKLYAKHYEHSDGSFPKIFISELLLDAFSQSMQDLTLCLIDQIEVSAPGTDEFIHSGTHWSPIYFDQYEKLRQESEYAAWMAAFGFRPNHFTVFVNELNSFSSLVELNKFLKKQGFDLNQAGGEIKGSPADYLEQSSTLAAPSLVAFADQQQEIPACYYEFAYRYPLENGKFYQGFVAKSADKIFESTDNPTEV